MKLLFQEINGVCAGHFLLTNLLLETMKRTSERSGREGRIINVSSICHSARILCGGVRFDKLYNGIRFMHSHRSYGISKLANILHANELARQLKVPGYFFFSFLFGRNSFYLLPRKIKLLSLSTTEVTS